MYPHPFLHIMLPLFPIYVDYATVTPTVNKEKKKKPKDLASPRQQTLMVRFLLFDGGGVTDMGADIDTDVDGEVRSPSLNGSVNSDCCSFLDT